MTTGILALFEIVLLLLDFLALEVAFEVGHFFKEKKAKFSTQVRFFLQTKK